MNMNQSLCPSPTTSNLNVTDDLQEKPCPLRATAHTLTQDLKGLQEDIIGAEGPGAAPHQ